MRYIGVASLTILVGCSTRTDSSNPATDSSHSERPDKTITKAINDSAVFAGVIRRFEDNGELYTTLFFKGDFDRTLYDFLAKSSDSLVYQDDEIKRSALPFPVAAEYFDLRALDEVEVYDTSGLLLGTARFERVEYLEEIIEAGFIAVFSLAKDTPGQPAYCLSNDRRLTATKNFNYNSTKTKTLDKKISQELNLLSSADLNVIELSLAGTNKTYLLISGDTTAFIYDRENKELLYKSDSREVIVDAIPIPPLSGERPLFLVSFALPETDVYWEGLLKFNGTSYELCPRNRFKP